MSINSLTISGNLGQDPSLKFLDDGTSITSGTIAYSRGQKDKTIWLKYTAFGKVGEVIAEYCKQGDTLTLQGRFDVDEWQTKEGEKRSQNVIIVTNVQLPPKKN